MPAETLQSKTVGFIDIGTNAIRLLVVRIAPDGTYAIVTAQREPARLGEGEFLEHRLQPQAMDRAILVCRTFAELSRSHGAEEVITVATSAVREAKNREEFLRRMQEAIGLEVRVISGREEARLIFTGLTSLVHLGDKHALFIDIGGGSTEVIVGTQRDYSYLDSISVGTVRLTSMQPALVGTDTVSPAQYQELCTRVRHAAVHTVQHIRQFHADLAYCSSGTAQNLAAVAERAFPSGKAAAPRPPDTTWTGEPVLTLADLKRTAALLCSLTLEQRRKVPGLNQDRADIIIAGAAILQTLMEMLQLEEVRVLAGGGVREGLLMDYLAYTGHAEYVHHLSVRERSILQLARACAVDDTHNQNITRLALDLFDSAREAGLHTLGRHERELLLYAATLHDIGAFLSYSNHHLHSYYLVHNADLLGFDQHEVEVMALTTLFHRKSTPNARHHGFAALDPQAQTAVRVLSLMIRLAESLDRGHQNAVQHAFLRAKDRKTVSLDIQASGDCRLELWGVQTRAKAVQKTLGRRLEISLNGRMCPIQA